MFLVLLKFILFCFIVKVTGLGKYPFTIPSYRYTSGINKWHMHMDQFCMPDARLICKATYPNGRLISLETEFKAKLYMELKHTILSDFLVGLFTYTHNPPEYRWSNCATYNSSLVPLIQEDVDESQKCYIAFIGEPTAHVMKAGCDAQKEFICEDTIDDTSCPLRTFFTSNLRHSQESNSRACDQLCTDDDYCWANLYLYGKCLIFRNTADGAMAEVTMKEKDCFADMGPISTVSASTGGCATSTVPPITCSTTSTAPGIHSTFEFYTATQAAATVTITDVVTITKTIEPDGMCATKAITVVSTVVSSVTNVVTRMADTQILTAYRTVYQQSNMPIHPSYITVSNLVPVTLSPDCPTQYITISPSMLSCSPIVSTVVEKVTESVAPHVVTIYQTMSQKHEMPSCITSIESVFVTPTISATTQPQVYIKQPLSVTYHASELHRRIEELEKQLKVNVLDTNARKRKKTSASDGRITVVVMGSTGVILVLIPLLIIFILDMPRIRHDLKHVVSQNQLETEASKTSETQKSPNARLVRVRVGMKSV